MTDIRDWANEADLNGEASPAGWPEGMPPSDVNNSAREMMAALRRSYVRQPWYAPGGEIVRVDSFKITIKDDAKVTNYSHYYSINQRVRVEGAEYTVNGFVSGISYEAPTTTIEFQTDAEMPLPGTIKEVYVGLSPSDVQGVAGPNLLGCIIGFTEEASQIGAGLLHANGQRFSPSLYPDLARLYFMGNNSDGTPNYRYGREKVGDEWWPKRPDVRGYFPRFLDDRAAGDSSRVDLGSPRVVGSKQADDNKSHIHSLRVHLGTENTKDNRNSYIAGNNYAASAERGMWHTAANATNTVSIASQGSESRPKNIAVVGVIIAYGGVVAGGLADVSEVLEDVRTTKELAQSLSVTIANLGDVMRYMGSVATYDDLPTVDNQVGDVYNVLDTGANYAWTAAGTWDEFGGGAAKWGSIEGDITQQADLQEALAKKIENTALATNSVAIGGRASSANKAVNVGFMSNAAAEGATAIGFSATSYGKNATAIGQTAYANAEHAIQIGQGANNTANTFNVGLSSSLNVQLLGPDGKIPAERLPDDIGGSEGYRSLDETQKTQLLLDGTYKGADVVDGEVFTEYDGKFVEFDKTPRAFDNLQTLTQKANDAGTYYKGKYIYAISGTQTGYNKIHISDDEGATWTAYTSPDASSSSSMMRSFLNFGDKLILVRSNSSSGTDYSRYVSDSGYDNWTEITTLPATNIQQTKCCKFKNKYYLIAEDGFMYESADAITWSKLSDFFGQTSTSSSSLFTDGEYLYRGNTKLYRYNGTTVEGPFTVPGSYNIHVNDTYFSYQMESATAYAFAKSIEGPWTSATAPTGYTFGSLAYTDGVYLAVNISSATSNIFGSTQDCLNWTQNAMPSGISSYATLAVGNGSFLISKKNKSSLYNLYKGTTEISYAYSLTDLSYTKDEVEAAGFLKNTATGSESTTLDGTASAYSLSLNIGQTSNITGNYGVALGYGSSAANNSVALGVSANAPGVNSVAIGRNAQTYGRDAIGIGCNVYSPKSVAIGYSAGAGSSSSDTYEGATAIGYYAKARAAHAIQLGYGTNSTANTFKVGLSSSLNVQLLDANGNIPAERLGFAPNGGAPSENYVGLALASSGEEYTTPADGFMMLSKVASTAGQYINLANQNAAAMISQQYATAASQILRVFLPVQKGDTVKANFSADGELKVYRFIYAKGAV